MKNNLKLVILAILVGTVLIVGSFGFPYIIAQLNLFVLATTLAVLIWYAYDTNRIANQTIESALRPIIMRQGKILDWKVNSLLDLEKNGFTLQFANQKNIAKDICGYIILDSKKYKLCFGNEVTEDIIRGNDNDAVKRIVLFEGWGWLPVEGILNASYNSSKFEAVKQSNEIYIEYQDIEGNKYYTKENTDYSQVSRKI